MPSSSTAELPDETDTRGRFVRQKSAFRQWVTADGRSGFPAEPDRYHLYVSYACPWAHRTIVFRRLKGLEEVIGLTVVDPLRDGRGWRFTYEPDPVNDFSFLAEAYHATDPGYSQRVTVPVLWDRDRGRIVNNESSEIIRMLNSEFDEWGDDSRDFYPEELRDGIDEINAEVYDNVNDGVYRCGFASSQEAYEEAFQPLFETLDRLDARLSDRRWLMGERLTEADWRLFTTLVRFDAVYYTHFKCNLRRISDHAHLWPYLRDLYQIPGVADTVRMDHIKSHYFETHRKLNPSGIVPVGPDIDFTAPHERASLGSSP